MQLFDIADDLSYKKKENYTLRHFKERINTIVKKDLNTQYTR